jgi:hypothetical protein
VHTGTSAPYIFRFFKISKFYISISTKNYDVKYIDRYVKKETTQKKSW